MPAGMGSVSPLKPHPCPSGIPALVIFSLLLPFYYVENVMHNKSYGAVVDRF